MAALEQFHGVFTLADTTLTDEQNTLAIDLHKNTVARNMGRKKVFEGRGQRAHKVASGILRTQDRLAMLCRHLHALGIGLKPAGVDQRRNRITEQLVKTLQPLLTTQIGQIAILHIADQLDPMGVKMLKITHQLKSGTIHTVLVDLDVLVILPAVEHLQREFADDALQLYKTIVIHSCPPPVQLLFFMIIPLFLLLCNHPFY